MFPGKAKKDRTVNSPPGSCPCMMPATEVKNASPSRELNIGQYVFTTKKKRVARANNRAHIQNNKENAGCTRSLTETGLASDFKNVSTATDRDLSHFVAIWCGEILDTTRADILKALWTKHVVGRGRLPKDSVRVEDILAVIGSLRDVPRKSRGPTDRAMCRRLSLWRGERIREDLHCALVSMLHSNNFIFLNKAARHEEPTTERHKEKSDPRGKKLRED